MLAPITSDLERLSAQNKVGGGSLRATLSQEKQLGALEVEVSAQAYAQPGVGEIGAVVLVDKTIGKHEGLFPRSFGEQPHQHVETTFTRICVMAVEIPRAEAVRHAVPDEQRLVAVGDPSSGPISKIFEIDVAGFRRHARGQSHHQDRRQQPARLPCCGGHSRLLPPSVVEV